MPYHVRITPKDPQRRHRDALALDKSHYWIEENIAAPRREGRDIFVDGQVFPWDSIDEIHITETDETSDELLHEIRFRRIGESSDVASIPDNWYVAHDGREVTDEFLNGPPGKSSDIMAIWDKGYVAHDGPEATVEVLNASPNTGLRPNPSPATDYATNRKAVMVIYGHDTEANNAVFDYLRAIGLQPREWGQLIQLTGSGSPYIGEVLDRAFRDAQAVVALFTPDEYVTARTPHSENQATGRYQARPNVLIEAGMALATHPTRTILAVLGNQELPSDLAGRHYIRLSHTAAEPLHALAARLHAAGCDTDTTGTDWLNAARFPDRDTVTQPQPQPSAPKPAPRRQHSSPPSGQPSTDGLFDREETEDSAARQVAVGIEPVTGQRYTHLITVSAPITYSIKQVEVQITWQTNGGLGMTSTGWAASPSRVDGERRLYAFRASVSPRIANPDPIVRFVNPQGRLYYQFRDHTQRFPQNTDASKAANEIDQWLRTGPSSD